MAKRKAKRGRPSSGLSEVPLAIRVPAALRGVMGEAAAELDITAAEAWRRAARLWLALPRAARETAGAVAEK